VPGGVRIAGSTGHVPPRERQQRAELELPRKRAVAAMAAEAVKDGMVIYLDAGTTCQSVVPFLDGRRDLTVVTNDFHVVISLFEHPERWFLVVVATLRESWRSCCHRVV
jgi:DeoR/GlpR family transcriptional regulator of sugar metabolism